MPSTAPGTLARTSTTPLPRFTPGPWYEHSPEGTILAMLRASLAKVGGAA